MPRRHPSDDAWSYFAMPSVFRNLTNRTEKGYSRPDGSGRSRTQDVRTTRVLLRAGLGLALPDTDGGSSDGDLATGGTGVLGVLGDFHLLDAIREEAKEVSWEHGECGRGRTSSSTRHRIAHRTFR
jgi:hypothetical protein